MEALFTPQSTRLLQALVLSGKRPDGLLFGHRRGDTLIITEILPTGGGFFSRLDNLWAIDDLTEGGLLGFFTFSDSPSKAKKLLAPWACGKIFLRINQGEQGEAEYEGARIEFESVFSLREIKIVFPDEEGEYQ
jgi:hypothetical protein